MWDLRLLDAFLAVARLNSFTRAAAELHVSQSTVTVHIRQLEESLGVTLFDRNSRKVVLTAVGARMLPAFERILSELDVAMRDARDWAGGKRGTVSVACLRSVATSLVPAAMARCHMAFPGIAVRIVDDVDERVAAKVRCGEVDFGIATDEYVEPSMGFERLLSDNVVAIFPRGHALSRCPTIELAALAEEQLILTESSGSLRPAIDRAFAAIGTIVRPAYEVSYVPTIIAMVRSGLGITILPATMVDSVAMIGLTRRRVHAKLRRDIGLIKRVGIAESPAASRFTEILREVARARPTPLPATGDRGGAATRTERPRRRRTAAEAPRWGR